MVDNMEWFNVFGLIFIAVIMIPNVVDEMGENLSLSVGNTIEFGYKIIHNYLIKKRWIFFSYLFYK